MTSSAGFDYCRTIRFHETDAAGVVYFANVITLCHEAYEAALMAEGFNLALFFSAAGDVAVPIVHAQTDFYRPMRCGDRIKIRLVPKQLNDTSFEISYTLYPHSDDLPDDPQTKRLIAKALTRHVCIQPVAQKRQALPDEITRWIAGPSAPND